MKILILSGKFGMGHLSAATALQAQLLAKFPGATVQVCDIVEQLMPQRSSALYQAFGAMVRHAKFLYNAYYTCNDKLPQTCKSAVVRLFLRPYHQLVQTCCPDVILSALPFGAQITSLYKQVYGAGVCAVTCITDVSAHSEWIAPHTDLYLVPAAEVKWALMRKKIPSDKIQVSGIPVSARFCAAGIHAPRADKHLLVSGGGLCLLPQKGTAFYETLSHAPHVSVTVLTGTNRALFDTLKGRWPNIHPVGFTNRVDAYMHRADLLLSKPGGITLFESMYAGVPMLVCRPELGQEKKNARFIERHGIGRVLWRRPADLAGVALALLEDGAQLERMRRNIVAVRGSLHADVTAAIARQLQVREMAQ